jgi:hypothetical protein
MPLRSSELAQIVWAETKTLGYGKADGSGDVNGIRRMVAQLAASTNGEGFDKRESPPPTNDPVYGDTVSGLLSICEGAQNAGAPQGRLIFWEAGDKTDRPNPATTPPPPAPWNTMQAGITYQGRFQPVVGGRLIDVFARAAVDGDADRPVMVNALSGTGLPDGKSIMLPKAATQARPKLGLSLFFVALAIFILAEMWSFGIGLASRLTLNEFGQTANILANAPTSDASKPSCNPSPPQDLLAFSLGPTDWRPQTDKKKDCASLYAAAQAKVASGLRKENSWLEWYASTALSWAGASGWTVSLVLPLGLALISFAMLFVATGYGVVGLGWGAIIDVRKRMSLTLAQLVLWSIVIFAGWLVLGLYNFGFAGLEFNDLDQAATATKVAADSEMAKAVKSFVLFPSVPYSLMGIIGLAGATPILSRLISGTVALGSASGQQQNQPMQQLAPNTAAPVPPYLDKRSSPSEAKLTDMAISEVAGAENLIDTTRLQLAGITGILVIGYVMLLFSTVSAIDPVRVALAAVKTTSVFTSMPAIDATFVALLAVSHAALLGSKTSDKQQNG